MRLVDEQQHARPLVFTSPALRWATTDTLRQLLVYAVLALALVLVGIPIYWMLLAAFKTQREIFTVPPTWIPLAPTLENFPAAWSQAPFGRFYINSILYTLVS